MKEMNQIEAVLDVLSQKINHGSTFIQRRYDTGVAQFNLNDPVTEQAIQSFEKQFKLMLPSEYKTFLRLHDGAELFIIQGLGIELYPLEKVIEMTIQAKEDDLIHEDYDHFFTLQGSRWESTSSRKKRRPVVVFYDFTKKGKAFYMITSTVTGYLSEQFDCEIKDLKAAGLDRPSVVRMGRGQRYDIWEANPLGRKIGELSIKDLVRVVDAFERVTRHERTRTQEQIENAKALEISNEQKQKQKKNDFEQDR